MSQLNKKQEIFRCLLVCSLLCLVYETQSVSGGVIRQRRDTTLTDIVVSTDEARAELEAEARAETETLLNKLFQTQILYFGKVKESLAPTSQRARDIDAYIVRLNQAIAVKDIEEKDRMWLNIYKEFNKSPLLLNKQSETGMTNEEYERVLADSGIQEVVKNFLADVAAYFWKMAKASGKVMEVAIDEYIKSKRDSLVALLNGSILK